MTTSVAQFKTALTNAQNAYNVALQTLYHCMIDLESLAATVEGIGGGAQSRFSKHTKDQWQDLPAFLEHPIAAPRATNFDAALKASSGTLTSSPTLNVSFVPGWVVPGLVVTDLTTGNPIGTVSSAAYGGTTITLVANAANAVTTGDILSYSIGGRVIDNVHAAVANYISVWSGS